MAGANPGHGRLQGVDDVLLVQPLGGGQRRQWQEGLPAGEAPDDVEVPQEPSNDVIQDPKQSSHTHLTPSHTEVTPSHTEVTPSSSHPVHAQVTPSHNESFH